MRGVASKYETEWLYQWIKNSQGLVKSGDALAVKLFTENNNSVMTSFPQLTDEDINNILAYTSQPKPEPVVADTAFVAESDDSGTINNIILGALALMFLLLVMMLILVNKTIKKIARANKTLDESHPSTPIWKALVKNQFLMMVSAIFLLLIAAYFVDLCNIISDVILK